EAFIGTIYASSSPYNRPSGGLAATVETLDADRLAAAWARGFDPARLTLIMAGDLDGSGGRGPAEIGEALFGASAGFDPRRGAGPFAARVAVNTEVTVPALVDLLAELNRIREAPVTAAELAAARDFLVGVFPLRFETPRPVVGALGGVVVHDLPDDELTTYRARIEAVSIDDVLAIAQAQIHPDRAAIVMVGDAARIASDLDAAAIGPLEVIRDDDPPAKEA